jgi:hypothetical protein
VNVADLQRFLADLARLLNSTESKKTAGELERVVEGLDPFKTISIADFAGFLPRAESYWRTGVIPLAIKKSPGPKPPPKPSIGLAELRAEVEKLYATASTADVTLELIDQLRPKLDKLNKADLVIVAQSIELVGMSSKTKPVILDSIISRLRSIKQSAMRTSIIDRPGVQY